MNIAKPCIQRHLVQELMKLYFQALAEHSFCLLFNNQGSTNRALSVLVVYQFNLVYAKNF